MTENNSFENVQAITGAKPAPVKLDTLTQGARFVTATAGKTVTHTAAGVVLGAEDVVTDPVAQLLATKTSKVGKFFGRGLVKAGSKVIDKAAELNTPEGKAALKEKLEKANERVSKIPGVNKAVAFAGQAASELKDGWNNAGMYQPDYDEPSMPEFTVVIQTTQGLKQMTVQAVSQEAAESMVKTEAEKVFGEDFEHIEESFPLNEDVA